MQIDGDTKQVIGQTNLLISMLITTFTVRYINIRYIYASDKKWLYQQKRS
jgi:hypothetical protein